jgi:hypothetical protein
MSALMTQPKRPARAIAAAATLVLVLLLLIPPNGILSDNEENYFALAERFVDGNTWPAKTAVFDVSRHRMLSDATLGALVSAIGYPSAQVVARLLAVAGYAVVLPSLFAAVGLSALDAALAVMGMVLIGQDIVGGEWLFGGYEAKVAAYVLVLAGLRLVLDSERLTATVLLFAAATWFHFLVGGFWFTAAMVLRLMEVPRDLRRVGAAIALFAILVAPLAGVIIWSRLADTSAAQATDVPAPDVIYSIIREPHHQSPFLSWAYFRDQWLRGYVMAAPMLMACLWVGWRGPERRLRVLAIWLAGLLAYLFLVLLPKYLDRDSGVLGKFYLFRPSSLILLLWLMLVLAVVMAILARRAWMLRGVLLAVAAPLFLYVQGGRVLREYIVHPQLEAEKRALVAAVVQTAAPGDIVLIDPAAEAQLLDFERRTGRPTLVMWKFAPTNDAELIEWYRRMQRRQTLFDRGCDTDPDPADLAFLLTTPANALHLVASCGPELDRVGSWVLLRRAVR